MEAIEHSDVSHSERTSPSATNSKEEESCERNRKNVVSMPALALNGRSDELIHEISKRCVSEFPLSKKVNHQENAVSEIMENFEQSEIAKASLDESESASKVSDIIENLDEETIQETTDIIHNKTEKDSTSIGEDFSHDPSAKDNDPNSTSSKEAKATREAQSELNLDVAKGDPKEELFKISLADSKEDLKMTSLNNDVNLQQIDSKNLTTTIEEKTPEETTPEETTPDKTTSSDPRQIQENGSTSEDHHNPKKNLSFEENEDQDPAPLRQKDPTKENPTKIFRESYFMKTKGKIYYKKKGPFSKWRSQFVILDDNKQQMCFFKSQEEYEKLARCKNTIDLRFITEIKHQKQRIFQSNFPFKVYRRAGLSTVKLAADSEEERARWITTIEEITERIKATPERDLLEPNQRSSTLPNIKNKKSTDDVSSDSETCTTSSAPEQDELIRPKKVSKTGFKIDSNQISSIKLKRTSSQMRETRESKLPEEDEVKEEVEANPQEKFGVSLRRVNTDKPKSSREDREKSPEYVEFKQKYNSLNTLRNNKTPNIPLNSNSIVKTALIDSVDQEDRGIVYPSQILKDQKDQIRKRSPSPHIPISKGVEAVMKNADEESVMETTSAENSLNVSQIRHATLAEVPQHESVIEDILSSDIQKASQSEPEKYLVVKGQTDESSIPTIQVSQQDSCKSETLKEDSKHNVDSFITENKHVNKAKMEIITNETAVVIDVNEPSSSSSAPIQESATPSMVPPPEEYRDSNIDPLKINAIKKFIQEMKSDASDTDSCNNLNVTVVDSSVENSPAIYPRKMSREMKADDSSANIRLSAFSYGSQVSTESEEPLPRLNFLGKADRTSTGSSVLKGASSSDEHKSDKTSDTEEMSELSGILREKATESKSRPDSSTSVLGGRSSLIAPEFTVVEEKSEELSSPTNLNPSFQDYGEQTVEKQLPSQVANLPKQVDSELIVENQAVVIVLDHPKSEVTTEIVYEADFHEELLPNPNTGLLDAIQKEQEVELGMKPQDDLEIVQLKQKDNINSDVKEASEPSDSETNNSKKEDKKYCNKMEMTLLTKTKDIVKEKKTFCKQISASSLHADEGVINTDANPDIKQTPGNRTTPKIFTENEVVITEVTDDSDGEIEILETQETSDFFPSYGGSDDVDYRIKDDHLNIEQTDAIRTSGIVGLKEFLKDNEDPSAAPTELKSSISRLGHSPAIEKLKDELPKQQIQ